MKEQYLGDGLYASFDGFMFILRAPSENGDHWVGLEPETLEAFDRFRAETAPRRASDLDIPPERDRTDAQRADMQVAWDIIHLVTHGHLLNSTEGHLAVLRGIQFGRSSSSDAVAGREAAIEESKPEATP